MSLSSTWGSNWLGRLIGWFRGPRDPIVRNIQEAIVVLDRMTNFIDSTKKNLESMYEQHQRRAKMFANEGRKDYEKIFLEELKHIASLISMFSKVHYDLMRVRYRLETLTVVEEPMRLLPEIIQELEMIKPEVEKLAPELATMLVEVERKVNSVMSVSSLTPIANMYVGEEKRESEKLPPLPPNEKPRIKESMAQAQTLSFNNVKKLVLNEIKRSGGVFVVGDFARKYGIPKHVIYMALRKLEEEGLIRSR